MAKTNFLSTILKTINDVQKSNKSNKNEQTADPSVFDLLRGKLSVLDQKSKEGRINRGKSPVSILDRIKKEIEGARRENKKDTKVATAPGSIFDNLLKTIGSGPKRQASSGIRKIVQDFQLDLSRVPQDVVAQVQTKYQADRKAFDKQYAQALYDLSKKFK